MTYISLFVIIGILKLVDSPDNCQREWDIYSTLKQEPCIGSQIFAIICLSRIFVPSLFPDSKILNRSNLLNCYPLKLIAHRYVIVDNNRRLLLSLWYPVSTFSNRPPVENQRVWLKSWTITYRTTRFVMPHLLFGRWWIKH